MVTGIDLVKCQIEIAAGFPLRFTQEEIKPRGFSLECRIYAEDPYNNFMPSPGKITHLNPPGGGPGIRYDNGTYEGYTVPLEYDSLLSKLITWGGTREEAIHRMLRALSEYHVYGIKTTIPFFKSILLHPKFFQGNYNTHFLKEIKNEREKIKPEEQTVALIAAGINNYRNNRLSFSSETNKRPANWKIQGRIRSFSNRL